MSPLRAFTLVLLVAALAVRPARAVADEVAAPVAATARARPVRIALECEAVGRTKACPTFLLGFIEKQPLLLSSPRAAAQVVLKVNTTEVAIKDHLLLRFVGKVADAPTTLELIAAIDTRGDDDQQRGQLEPVFLRGVALYVAALHPTAVKIAFETPDGAEVAVADTTAWGGGLTIGGGGSWTREYQSASGWASADVSRVDDGAKLTFEVGGDGGFTRNPPLVVDGEEISLDTENYGVRAGLLAGRNLSDRWAVAVATTGLHQDGSGQYRYRVDGKAGIEWDLYPSDDPRGNRLAVLYLWRYAVESYNLRNEIGERFAHYPGHELLATASVRRDKVTLGLGIGMSAELIHPERRHSVSVSPSISVQLGDHIDINLSMWANRLEQPAPVIDTGDYMQVLRSSYAQPLSIGSNFSVRVHWDRTNGKRNNRFDF